MGGSAGYSCTEIATLLTNESVTTVTNAGGFNSGNFSYSEAITADVLRVTFNGVEYTCNKRVVDNGIEYGALYDESTDSMDWSEYPFNIYSSHTGVNYNNSLLTEITGTYQVKIETLEKSAEVSECFKKAVNSLSPLLRITNGMDANKVINAYGSGEKLLYMAKPNLYDQGYYYLTDINELNNTINFTPTPSNTRVTIEDGRIKIITSVS